MKRDQDDLVIERPCLDILQNSEVVNRIQIINGLEEGNNNKASQRREGGNCYL